MNAEKMHKSERGRSEGRKNSIPSIRASRIVEGSTLIPQRMSYAARSAYEFTESPKSSPARPNRPNTPSAAEPPGTPSKTGTFSSFWSNKWGSFTAKASEVASRARTALHEAVQSDTPQPEEDAIFNLDLAFAPWENLGTADEKVDEELKQHILNISDNPRHLLNVPPSEEPWNFDDWLPVALEVMKKDEKMREARTSLVPKELDEETFWRSYFFRVNMLKRAYGVSELPQLKEGVEVPQSAKLRTSLANSSASLSARDSMTDLTASSSSLAVSSLKLGDDSDEDSDGLVGSHEDDINIDGTTQEREMAENATMGEISKADNAESAAATDPTSDDSENIAPFVMDDDEEPWTTTHEFDPMNSPLKKLVPDHILKALED